MAQVSMTVELEAAARASFEALCKDFGMSVNTAFRLFVNAVINQRRIPFEIKASDKGDKEKKLDRIYAEIDSIRDKAEKGLLPELTEEEIEEEIRLYREGK